MRSIICESMRSDRVVMVNQHALRATTQLSLWTTSGKILRKNLRPDVERFAAFLDELRSSSLNFHYQRRCSVILIFWTFNLKIPVVLFQAHEGKVVGFVWRGADRGCICCDMMLMCGISVLREQSADTSFYFYKRKCSCLVNKK